jgi:hypothetical protein
MLNGPAPQAVVAERPLGYFQTAAGAFDTAQTLAALCGGSLPIGTCLVIFKANAQAFRFRDDGVAPTAAIGYPIAVGQDIQFTDSNLSGLQVIAQVAGAAADILCYGR